MQKKKMNLRIFWLRSCQHSQIRNGPSAWVKSKLSRFGCCNDDLVLVSFGTIAVLSKCYVGVAPKQAKFVVVDFTHQFLVHLVSNGWPLNLRQCKFSYLLCQIVPCKVVCLGMIFDLKYANCLKLVFFVQGSKHFSMCLCRINIPCQLH